MDSVSTADTALFARSHRRVVSGVAAGLADFLGVDLRVVRGGLVLMSFGCGAGLVAYAVLYALSGRESDTAHQYPVTTKHNIGFGLISFGVFVVGAQLFVDNVGTLFSLRTVWLSVLATVAVLTLLFGPWLLRLLNQVNDERRDRIRSEARADISAHLHDSVLNTLALIQRTEAKPEVIMLARRQERELRAWMQGRSATEHTEFAAAIDALTTRVEAQYNVSVDAVVVGGQVDVNDRIEALINATQEATVNAARHSGASAVSIYAEVDTERLTVFIRDQGAGFDRADVAEDRQGVSESIEGRMRRAGGTAIITSALGSGTEVELQLPRNSS